MKLVKGYCKFMDILDKILYKLIGVAMIVMAAVMVYQVFLRYVLGKSNLWAEEVARYLFVYVTFVGSFIAIRRNAHLQVDFFTNLMKPKVKKVFSMITNILVTAFLVYLIYIGMVLVDGGFRNITAGLNISMAYIYMAVPLGGILMLLGMIEQIMLLIVGEESEVSK